jgi:hypothetical protein
MATRRLGWSWCARRSVAGRRRGPRRWRCRPSPWSRSTSRHSRPQSSPRRAPRTTVKARHRPSSGASSLATASSRATRCASGGDTPADPVAGAVASLTGLWAIQPQTRACLKLKAPDRTLWTSPTADVDSGQPVTQSSVWTTSSAPGRVPVAGRGHPAAARRADRLGPLLPRRRRHRYRRPDASQLIPVGSCVTAGATKEFQTSAGR